MLNCIETGKKFVGKLYHVQSAYGMNCTEQEYRDLLQNFDTLDVFLTSLQRLIPEPIYTNFEEFFESFRKFLKNCLNRKFYETYYDDLNSSVNLLIECMDELEKMMDTRIKRCICK